MNQAAKWVGPLAIILTGACSTVSRIEGTPIPAAPEEAVRPTFADDPADGPDSEPAAAAAPDSEPVAGGTPEPEPEPAAVAAPEPPSPPAPPSQLDDSEIGQRIERLDSLLRIPMNAYDIHDKGRKHIRAFTDSLQKTLLTPAQTGRIAAYIDELLERHPEATRMLTRQQFLVENLTPGKTAPELVGKDLDGAEFALDDFRGNIVVLFFTGEWCAPCRAEYPHQRQMLERYRDENVVLLGVNSDGELDRVLEAKEREGLHYRTWWDESTRGPIAQSWIVWAWPTTYILDARGVIRYVDRRGDDIIAAVDELLKEHTLSGGS